MKHLWTRWHMTLGRWMRDYLYIPLGGNRVNSKARLYFNLCFAFIISGFWHGAAWNFVAWGAFHGLFLILDRIFLRVMILFFAQNRGMSRFYYPARGNRPVVSI